MRKTLLAALLALAMCLPGVSFAETWKTEFPPELWQHIDGSTSMIPLSQAVLAYVTGLTDADAAKLVRHSTTPDAYLALMSEESEVDLIFVTPPSADELHAATVNGMELELVPIAREALVMLVNTDNPVISITSGQLRDIYRGKITNWKDVGGVDAPIIPYQRSLNSGSQTLFQQLLMGESVPMDPADALRLTSMDFLVNAVSAYENAEDAMGYSVYYYITHMYGNDRLRMLAVDGVVPDANTIAQGRYSLCASYYAVMRADLPKDAEVRKLVDFLVSTEGQEVLEAAGYVPLAPLQEVAP